ILSVDTWWVTDVSLSAVCWTARNTTAPSGWVIFWLCTCPDALTRRCENWMLRLAVLRPTRSAMISRTWLQCRGSKSAIQSPENLLEEPSRLRDDAGSSASRSSRVTPSGELENSSTTRPWYPASSIRSRFRTLTSAKLKTSSRRLPPHTREVSVLPSNSRSVVPDPSAPSQATPKSIEVGWTNVSDITGSKAMPALKSTVAEQVPRLVLLMNSSQ